MNHPKQLPDVPALVMRLREAKGQLLGLEGELRKALEGMKENFGNFEVAFDWQEDGIVVKLCELKIMEPGVGVQTKKLCTLPVETMAEIARYVLEVVEREHLLGEP